MKNRDFLVTGLLTLYCILFSVVTFLVFQFVILSLFKKKWTHVIVFLGRMFILSMLISLRLGPSRVELPAFLGVGVGWGLRGEGGRGGGSGTSGLARGSICSRAISTVFRTRARGDESGACSISLNAEKK